MSLLKTLFNTVNDKKLTQDYINDYELQVIRELLDRVIFDELRSSEKPLRLVDCIELIVGELEARRELEALKQL